MTARPHQPAPGTRLRYRDWGRIHPGIVQSTPTQRADDSFTIQDIAPPFGCIQAWPGDPRILSAEDDDAG